MFKWILLILLFYPSLARADFIDHVTMTRFPPGSSITEYGGPYAAIRNAVVKYMGDLWEDQYLIYYEQGEISYLDYLKGKDLIENEIDSCEINGRWWNRTWNETLVESAGGALGEPIILYKGYTCVILDLGFCYLTNSGKFKIRTLELTLDYAPLKESIEFSGSGIKFKLSPKIKFGSSNHVEEIGDLIRSVSLEFSIKNIKRFLFNVVFKATIKYVFKDEETILEFGIEFPMWSN